jgi:hypothetical protein
LIRFFYAWLVLVEEGWDSFEKHVRIIILGDDVTLTVHEDYIATYSGKAIAEVLYADFGVILETPDEEARPWYELGFLQMHFAESEFGMWTHVLDPARVVSSLLQGGRRDKLNDPVAYMERLGGIRNASWGDPQIRHMVVDVKEAWESAHPEESKTTAWKLASKGWLSDSLLAKLYFGLEAELQFQAPLQYSQNEAEKELLPVLKRLD